MRSYMQLHEENNMRFQKRLRVYMQLHAKNSMNFQITHIYVIMFLYQLHEYRT
jgi:hypothetical protein